MRRRLGKHIVDDRARLAIAIAMAVLAGLFVEVRSRQADQVRASWAPAGAVFVATESIDRGSVITADQVRLTEAPKLLTPTNAATTVIGLTVSAPLSQGQVVTESHLADGGSHPPQGHSWIAVPVDPVATPDLGGGDAADLFGVDPFGGSFVVAEAVRVVSYDEGRVVVEVPTSGVSAVATQIATGLVIAVITAQ